MLDLPAIKKLCEAAAEGPWLSHVGEFVSQAETYMAICRVNRTVIADAARGITVSGGPGSEQPNKDFIAQARTLVPQLVEVLEEAQAIEADRQRAWRKTYSVLKRERDAAQAENARLQARVEETDEVMGLAIAALNERIREVGLLKRERDDYKALAGRRKEALDAWVRYSLSSKPSKELLVEALRLTDAAEEPR